jgi:nanoRNase/pAp phosphatase (c-di-AMP/oligoRNAs hydrolase)
MTVQTIEIPSEKLDQLRQACGSGPVLILTHDNPDPDGLASGKALAHLLAFWGIESRLQYSGIISRSENKAMHDLLTPEWEQVYCLEGLEQYSAAAMLDTQPGAGNNRFMHFELAQIVIDHHHPIRENIKNAQFVDLRPEMGATSSMLFQYLWTVQAKIPADLATALFYGLKTDTQSLSRGASQIDKEIYTRLLDLIDHQALVRIEQAGLPKKFYQAVDRALNNTVVYGSALIADLGEMHRPDFGAEIADLLIRLENARAVLCLGVYEQTLHLSVRTIPMGEDAGKFVQSIIMPPGKAGGHGTMAGGQFPIEDEVQRDHYVRVFSQRFLKLVDESTAGERLLDDAPES